MDSFLSDREKQVIRFVANKMGDLKRLVIGGCALHRHGLFRQFNGNEYVNDVDYVVLIDNGWIPTLRSLFGEPKCCRLPTHTVLRFDMFGMKVDFMRRSNYCDFNMMRLIYDRSLYDHDLDERFCTIRDYINIVKGIGLPKHQYRTDKLEAIARDEFVDLDDTLTL